MEETTRIIRATLAKAKKGEPLHQGPVFAGPFQFSGDPVGPEYTYGRSGNPTWTALERAIGLMEVDDRHEAAGVRVFGSGMAAVAAVFAAVLRPGDTVVVQGRAYFQSPHLLQEVYEPVGVKVEVRSVAELNAGDVGNHTRLVFVETPSNPGMEIVDLRKAAEATHAQGGLLAVDNTTATPLGQRPLMWGADLAVSSDSKAMCGHSDLVMGHVATLDVRLLEKLDRHRNLTGGIVGPMEAWLMLRSLATLPLRLEKSSLNAVAIAEFLSGKVEVVFPGLMAHPGNAIVREQMLFPGPVLGFTLPGKAAAAAFLRASELVTEATSFGGIATTAERRARWGHDDVPPGFIRMSVGCEDAGDLIADIGQALAEALRLDPLVAMRPR